MPMTKTYLRCGVCQSNYVADLPLEPESIYPCLVCGAENVNQGGVARQNYLTWESKAEKRLEEFKGTTEHPIETERPITKDPIRDFTANEKQIGGNHYKGTIEVWDFIVAHDLDYFQGNVVKYVTRCWKKAGLEDLRKAQHYLEKYIEVIE